MVESPKVDFLIIGAQKAGTTALNTFLKPHPDIFLHKRLKELHFFDKDARTDWATPDYALYERFFAGKRPGQRAGEATPIYAFWPPAAERIARYNPDMRLIMCLRNPAERAFSHWQMGRQRRQEWLSFSDAIRTGRHRILIGGLSFNRFSYVERGFYGEQIARLHRHFPAEQLLVMTHDTMRSDLHGFLDHICDFIGVARFADYPENRIIRPQQLPPPSGTPNPDDIAYLNTLYREDIEKAERLTGLDLSAWRSDDGS
ncbi:MAG: sulfotransferase [Pseudomonadota bacterium]